jgi:hypothetical protein
MSEDFNVLTDEELFEAIKNLVKGLKTLDKAYNERNKATLYDDANFWQKLHSQLFPEITLSFRDEIIVEDPEVGFRQYILMLHSQLILRFLKNLTPIIGLQQLLYSELCTFSDGYDSKLLRKNSIRDGTKYDTYQDQVLKANAFALKDAYVQQDKYKPKDARIKVVNLLSKYRLCISKTQEVATSEVIDEKQFYEAERYHHTKKPKDSVEWLLHQDHKKNKLSATVLQKLIENHRQ